ncbi:MAG: hypothetical protein FJ041_06400 [Candidatus Cloacimonetes bacterium]|nr:hypothetical protein [Candidatus Cloacimonadota bacterium]
MKKRLFPIILLFLIAGLLAADFNWFSQGDERWKTDKLGQSKRTTVGRSGCVLSCLAMLLNAEASNPYITPGDLNAWLKQNGGYSGARMRWEIPGNLDGKGVGFELVAQISKGNNWKFLSEQLTKGNKVIVKVKGRRSHWVLVTKQDGPYNKASSYMINDPGTKSYVARTLAYYGGFKKARSYSGNWLDEDAFSLDTEICVVPVDQDEFLFYDIVNAPRPADVYVRIENKLQVPINGFFILGLFDKDGNFMRTVDYDFASLEANAQYDLMYEMDDITEIQQNDAYVNILYSKYFNHMPSSFDTLALIKSNVSREISDDDFSQNLEDIDGMEVEN